MNSLKNNRSQPKNNAKKHIVNEYALFLVLFVVNRTKLWRILKNTKIQARIISIGSTLSKRNKITQSKKKKIGNSKRFL